MRACASRTIVCDRWTAPRRLLAARARAAIAQQRALLCDGGQFAMCLCSRAWPAEAPARGSGACDWCGGRARCLRAAPRRASRCAVSRAAAQLCSPLVACHWLISGNTNKLVGKTEDLYTVGDHPTPFCGLPLVQTTPDPPFHERLLLATARRDILRGRAHRGAPWHRPGLLAHGGGCRAHGGCALRGGRARPEWCHLPASTRSAGSARGGLQWSEVQFRTGMTGSSTIKAMMLQILAVKLALRFCLPLLRGRSAQGPAGSGMSAAS